MNGITSPEGIIMLCVAILLDFIGFIIFLIGTWFGIDDYAILDILGGMIIGGWLLIRHTFSGSSQNSKEDDKQDEDKERIENDKEKEYNKNNKISFKVPEKNPIKNSSKNLLKKTAKRFGLNFLIELIPVLGGFYPGWTITVWKEMKN